MMGGMGWRWGGRRGWSGCCVKGCGVSFGRGGGNMEVVKRVEVLGLSGRVGKML